MKKLIAGFVLMALAQASYATEPETTQSCDQILCKSVSLLKDAEEYLASERTRLNIEHMALSSILWEIETQNNFSTWITANVNEVINAPKVVKITTDSLLLLAAYKVAKVSYRIPPAIFYSGLYSWHYAAFQYLTQYENIRKKGGYYKSVYNYPKFTRWGSYYNVAEGTDWVEVDAKDVRSTQRKIFFKFARSFPTRFTLQLTGKGIIVIGALVLVADYVDNVGNLVLEEQQIPSLKNAITERLHVLEQRLDALPELQ